jgi:two-component system chemotaxis response regulator CheY
MAKLLIVDDSDILRLDLKAVLVGAGHEVLEGENGKIGLEKAAGDSGIQLIITDLNMPEMDGITMVKNIRSQTSHKETPVFMLTTESSRELRDAGKEAGIMLWIVKPFKGDKVLAAVDKVLSKTAG